MRLAITTVAGFLGSFAASSTAGAQIIPVNEPRQIIYEYGKCAVKRHAGSAAKAVLRNVDSLTLAKDYSALINGDCVPKDGRLTLPGDDYLYALADALFARELATEPVPDLSNVPRLERRSLPSFAHLKRRFGYDVALNATYREDAFQAVDDFGECVVRQSPASVKELLMTEPESVAEAGRFEALRPALSECAPEGKTLELTKLLVRGTVALSYYRLAKLAPHIPC